MEGKNPEKVPLSRTHIVLPIEDLENLSTLHKAHRVAFLSLIPIVIISSITGVVLLSSNILERKLSLSVTSICSTISCIALGGLVASFAPGNSKTKKIALVATTLALVFVGVLGFIYMKQATGISFGVISPPFVAFIVMSLVGIAFAMVAIYKHHSYKSIRQIAASEGTNTTDIANKENTLQCREKIGGAIIDRRSEEYPYLETHTALAEQKKFNSGNRDNLTFGFTKSASSSHPTNTLQYKIPTGAEKEFKLTIGKTSKTFQKISLTEFEHMHTRVYAALRNICLSVTPFINAIRTEVTNNYRNNTPLANLPLKLKKDILKLATPLNSLLSINALARSDEVCAQIRKIFSPAVINDYTSMLPEERKKLFGSMLIFNLIAIKALGYQVSQTCDYTQVKVNSCKKEGSKENKQSLSYHTPEVKEFFRLTTTLLANVLQPQDSTNVHPLSGTDGASNVVKLDFNKYSEQEAAWIISVCAISDLQSKIPQHSGVGLNLNFSIVDYTDSDKDVGRYALSMLRGLSTQIDDIIAGKENTVNNLLSTACDIQQTPETFFEQTSIATSNIKQSQK